jgi:hypothetical protein
MSKHWPLQTVNPELHRIAHWLLRHSGVPLPPGHFVPQAPQFWVSLVRFAQAPLHWVSLAGHVSLHTPATHTGAEGPQVVEQVPQCAASLEVSTSHPSVASALQSANPLSQAMEHFDALQEGVPCTGLQTVPQAPQLARSLVVLTHTALQITLPGPVQFEVQAPATQ